MADRFPIIVNSSSGRLEELSSGDNLNLQNSGIVGASTITSQTFVGNLSGTATTSIFLQDAANVITGILSTSRLSGTYPISVTGSATTSLFLANAANIIDGIINPNRLSGTYNINISGTSGATNSLLNAANIQDGVINPARLSGTYDINITGTASAVETANFATNAGFAVTSQFLTNAENIIAGTVDRDRLSGTYDISITGSSYTADFTPYADSAGIATNAVFSTNAVTSTNVNGGYGSLSSLSVVGFTTLSNVEANDIEANNISAVSVSSTYFGFGAGIVGIVTQLNVGIGLTLTSTQLNGKGVVDVSVRTDTIGKTIFVSMNGDDLNSGLVESDAKRTIKGAISIAVPGDTVKVFPGTYVEDNPIIMPPNTSIEGAELRNCLVTPLNPSLDLFQTNDGCHITDLSFVGRPAENRAAVVSFKPLLGVSADRFFDGARMIRQNLNYIAYEAVGFLTSGYSGYAGTHREQDAAKLLYKNLDFIAAEAVGFITSTQYKSPVFSLPDLTSCKDDVKDVLASVANDLIATGNAYSVGAAKSYFINGVLSHITGVDANGYSIADATIAAFNRAAGIATFVINNYPWGSVASGSTTNITGFLYDNTTGISTITSVGHGVTTGDIVKLENIKFTCPGGSGITTDIFPDGTDGYFFKVIGWASTDQFVIKAGVSTIPHVYDSGGTVERYDNYQEQVTQTIDPSVIRVPYGCIGIGQTINSLVGIVTSAIGAGNTSTLPTVVNGIRLDINTCARDLKLLWLAICHDITRGGNSKCVGAAKSYFNANGTLKAGLLNNPLEQEQTVKVMDYSFDIARSVINNCTWGGVIVGGPKSVSDAVYTKETGVVRITTSGNHGLSYNDPVRIERLKFTCPGGSGITTEFFPDGKFGYVFPVKKVINDTEFEVVVGISSIDHTYVEGGVIKKYKNFQDKYGQIKDLSMQKDPATGYNDVVNSCTNVISAVRSCVGVVTTIIGVGFSAFRSQSNPTGIRTTFPGNAGLGITSIIGISTAAYDHTTGTTILSVPGLAIKKGDRVEVRDLNFSCNSGGGISTQAFPSGRYGYEFYVDRILDNGSIVINTGVSTISHTYVGGGYVVNRAFSISTASYDNLTGITTITAPGAFIKLGDVVNVQDLLFECNSGGGPGTALYPSGKQGYDFKVIGISTGSPVAVTTAVYDNLTGIATITAPGIGVSYNSLVEIRNLQFTCPDSPPNLLYPSGKNGYTFKVLSSIGSTFTVNVGPSTIPHTYVSGGTVKDITNAGGSDTFIINTGVSTIPHTYISGGVIRPPYSTGVGIVNKGPYVRNCTNFIANSIGMKVDGFEAEPGDKEDNGVTGAMSVDSYTQYNQGGIGVSITNGSYCQLVSIFTICDDIAIYTSSGGQCDITNSNASFGNYGLYSNGVGDNLSRSIYRYTGTVLETAQAETDTVVISGVGTQRPYDGQAIYFGELYYTIGRIDVTNGGSGYATPPRVIIDAPTGPNGIRAEAIATIQNGSVVAVDLISTGNQYLVKPNITFVGGGGVGAAATVTKLDPIYYNIERASLPSAGISTVVMTRNLNNTIGAGTTVYFARLSLQIATSISLEWVGAGTNINTAKPGLGGVTIQENEVVKENGGQVVYTSTNQAGNFQIGDDIVINQLTGTISGRAFSQSLLNTVTPLIIALGK